LDLDGPLVYLHLREDTLLSTSNLSVAEAQRS